MSEVNISNQKSNKRRSKKLSTSIDLTPMVDLGFLLITFFIFTTSMSEPKSMKLNLPKDDHDEAPNTTSEKKTINIVLFANRRAGYYMGADASQMKYTGYGSDGIRKVIINARNNVATNYGSPNELVVLIKPSSGSTFNNVVQIMDEMIINEISRYVLMDPSEKETGAGGAISQ